MLAVPAETVGALRVAVVDYYRRSGERLPAAAWLNTLRTNSVLAEQRARSILRLLYARTGTASLHGLDVLDAGCGFGSLAVVFASYGAHVSAIDPNGDRLAVGHEVAAAHGLPVEFAPGRMERLAFSDASFDL